MSVFGLLFLPELLTNQSEAHLLFGFLGGSLGVLGCWVRTIDRSIDRLVLWWFSTFSFLFCFALLSGCLLAAYFGWTKTDHLRSLSLYIRRSTVDSRFIRLLKPLRPPRYTISIFSIRTTTTTTTTTTTIAIRARRTQVNKKVGERMQQMGGAAGGAPGF